MSIYTPTNFSIKTKSYFPGAIVDAIDFDHSTPLHYACERDQVDASLLLLLHHANLNARGKNV